MKIKKSDVKKGFRFQWFACNYEYSGLLEVVCFRKDLSEIYCYRPTGKHSTIREAGELARFDERIINNEDFIVFKN